MQDARVFCQAIIEASRRDRMPELFGAKHPEALYSLQNRSGVSVIVLPTTALAPDQRGKLLRYRLAQYLAVGFVDMQMVFEAGLEYEPESLLAPTDIHFLAGAAETGELLCYASLARLHGGAPGATMRSRERPLFPVEETFGWGVYNRLNILPDIPLDRIVELKRFVRNQRLSSLDELAIRAPIEIGLALARVFTGPLRMEVDAFVGDFEENVGKRNLDYFHLPLVVLHGALPVTDDRDYMLPHFQDDEAYPFAALVSDMSELVRSRLPAVEEGLEQPGKRGVLALLNLKRGEPTFKSSLEPQGGLAPLSETRLPRHVLSMQARRELLNLGNQLRLFDPFHSLSVAEATTLRSFMQHLDIQAGKTILHQGDDSDSLYFIEDGQAEVRLVTPDLDTIALATLGAGDYFGEIGLLTGGARTADVVSKSTMKLLCLSRENYERYLSERIEIEQQIAVTAANRAIDTLRKSRGANNTVKPTDAEKP